MEKGILGGHMAAGQDDQIALPYQLFGFIEIISIQHRIVAERHALLGKDLEHIGAKRAI